MARPSKAKVLTNLELEVMQVVWDSERPMTVREVVDALHRPPRRSAGRKQHAYTTIQTMLMILKRKGILRSRPGTGRAHVYQARVTREAVTNSMVGDFLDRLFAGRAQPLLTRLLEHDSLDPEELADLRAQLGQQLGADEEPEA